MSVDPFGVRSALSLPRVITVLMFTLDTKSVLSRLSSSQPKPVAASLSMLSRSDGKDHFHANLSCRVIISDRDFFRRFASRKLPTET